MPKLNIKLGDDMNIGGPISMPESDKPKKYYPNFRIESDEKPELPHEGHMHIKFRKTASEHHEDPDGDNHYSCTIEVHEIIDVESSEPEAPARNRSKEAGEALDELKASRKKSVDY